MDFIKAITQGAVMGTQLSAALWAGVLTLLGVTYALTMAVEAVGMLPLLPIAYTMCMPKA